MKLLITIILISIACFTFDRFLLWVEFKGWIYYRRRKPNPGGLGNALMELQKHLHPQARHEIQVQKKEQIVKKSQKDKI